MLSQWKIYSGQLNPYILFSKEFRDISGARSTKSLESGDRCFIYININILKNCTWLLKLHHFMEFRDSFSWCTRTWKFFICFLGMEGYGIHKAHRLNRKWPVRNLKNIWRKTPHHRQKTGNKITIFFFLTPGCRRISASCLSSVQSRGSEYGISLISSNS